MDQQYDKVFDSCKNMAVIRQWLQQYNKNRTSGNKPIEWDKVAYWVSVVVLVVFGGWFCYLLLMKQKYPSVLADMEIKQMPAVEYGVPISSVRRPKYESYSSEESYTPSPEKSN